MARSTTVQHPLPRQRHAGVCLHITSLPGRYGIGEIGGAACAFIDRMTQMNLHVWQILPTGPTSYGDSPYQPLSTFAGNELFIDVEMLVRDGLLGTHETDVLLTLPETETDYGTLIPRKQALLERAAGRFQACARAQEKAAYDDFVHRNDTHWLHDYALFRLIKTRNGERAWPEWDDPALVHRDPAALRKVEATSGTQLESVKVIQYLFHRQWEGLRDYARERGVLLFGDMPIYLALDSADAWVAPDILQIDREGGLDLVAGVPPDYFSEDGQLWGNPLYDWAHHASNGYAWWIERMRYCAELVDLVRIDHFRGFEAYWAVPFGASNARIGEWLPGPVDGLFDAMRDALGTLPIVAEDLGVITPEVEQLRDRHEIPGMRVLQLDFRYEDFDVSDVPEWCVCYTGTHDNDTCIGWFRGSPGDTRSVDELERTRRDVLRATGGTPQTIHEDLIRLAFSSRACLAVVPLQDYLGLGSETRFNLPGTSGTNWRWRFRASDLTQQRQDQVARLVSDGGRG